MSKRILGMLWLVVIWSACGGGGSGDDDTPDAGGEPLACEVAIVGGGAGGLHTAYRLASEIGDGVCLFEKEAWLGGRIYDVARDDGADAPRWGTGALRVMEGQQILFDLADELSITLETPPLEADLISARGGFAFSKNDFLPLYPNMTNPDPGDQETALYVELMEGPNRANIGGYADFRAYIQDTVGAEEFRFLHDMSRFRADFEYPLDARGYMDYLDEEWNVCCTPSYPVGGMSEFIRGMEAGARADGVQIFTEEPVSAIARDGDGYRLVTSAHVVTAARVVIAIPPSALDWLTGDVVDEIRAQPEYQDLLGVKVATVTQWWPNRWWDDIANPDGAPPDNNVWRAWTTEHCLNFIEIPLGAYGRDQMVTRSVYDDDLNCVLFWEELAKSGTAAVEAEIKRGLEYLFNGNGVSTPKTVTIPDPVKTHVQIWPGAWHWLRAGATTTNAEVFAWAVEPLAGEEVALVGEAYYPNRSGWSDAAYKSSINLLNTRYGMDLPGLRPAAPRAERRVRSQGGH